MVFFRGFIETDEFGGGGRGFHSAGERVRVCPCHLTSAVISGWKLVAMRFFCFTAAYSLSLG